MKKYFIIILFFLMFLTTNISYSKEINTKLMNKVIVIDPGHGGKDAGTSVGGIYEKDINLSIALLLRDELIRNGATVILTRDDDYDLSSPNIDRRKKSDFDNRIKLINNSDVDLYLSIHINFLSNSKYYGAQVFYTKGNELLANVMQQSFNSYLKSPMDEKEVGESIYMYDKLNPPGLLLECGFLSNSREKNLLVTKSYQEKIVNAIVKALLNYY